MTHGERPLYDQDHGDHATGTKTAGRVRTETGPQAGPRLPRRRAGRRHQARRCWSGNGPYFPAYYFPAADVRAELIPAGETEHSPSRGDAEISTWAARRPPRRGRPCATRTRRWRSCATLVRLDWDAMGEWLEEDEPVYTHPRDPYTRVDILASSRHVRVEVDGVTVADSRQPRILFETGLPPRYYLPLTDVRMDLLRPVGHPDPLPVQGHGQLLVGARPASRPHTGHRVDLPHPAAGEPEGRRPGLLLRREGRRLPRRRASGTAADALQLTVISAEGQRSRGCPRRPVTGTADPGHRGPHRLRQRG